MTSGYIIKWKKTDLKSVYTILLINLENMRKLYIFVFKKKRKLRQTAFEKEERTKIEGAEIQTIRPSIVYLQKLNLKLWVCGYFWELWKGSKIR